MNIRERFNAWMQTRFDAAMLPIVRQCVTDVAEPVDYERLALEVSTLKEFGRELCDQVSDSLQTEVCRQVADRVIDQIDTSDIAEKVAETMDASDVASYMDAEDVANYIDVDSDCIAEKVAEDIDVSSCIDYDRLAEALVAKLKEAWA